MKTVLIAEDSEDDAFAMKLACKRAGIPHRLQIVTDGEMAVDYLSGKGAFVNRMIHPLPDILFLDVKIPKRSGHEVLTWIRSQPNLKDLPVVMLTGSALKADVEQAYKLGATSSLQKVADLEEFEQTVRLALEYWLKLNIAVA